MLKGSIISMIGKMDFNIPYMRKLKWKVQSHDYLCVHHAGKVPALLAGSLH